MIRSFATAFALVLLTGCASQQAGPAPSSATPETPDTSAPIETTTETYDPWEGFNRGVYRFNARFDEAIYLPVANGYRRVVPAPVRTGVGNFFNNIGEIGNTANHLLQGRPRYGGRSAGRFLINTTIGILGLFDVAERMGLTRTPTNFGNTLGRWGIGAGPYLVIPILGPSTLRDGIGRAADFGLERGVDPGGIYSGDYAWPLTGLYAVDARTRVSFRYYQTGSPFEYELVRFLYTRKRAIEVDGAQSRPDTPPEPPPTEPAAPAAPTPPADIDSQLPLGQPL